MGGGGACRVLRLVLEGQGGCLLVWELRLKGWGGGLCVGGGEVVVFGVGGDVVGEVRAWVSVWGMGEACPHTGNVNHPPGAPRCILAVHRSLLKLTVYCYFFFFVLGSLIGGRPAIKAGRRVGRKFFWGRTLWL